MNIATSNLHSQVITPRDVVELIAQSTRWPDRVDPWSLAELRLDETQREQLLAWCTSLSDSEIEHVGAGLAKSVEIDGELVSGQAAFGIALLLAFAEIARREASEGRLWSHVRKRLSTKIGQRHPLFDAGGQPTATTKQLLERGARRFGVRHAFDLIDHDGYGHNWYTSVFLQFGITRRGFEQNASYWLRNQNLSRTIRLLLDRDGTATGSGRSLYSSDFDQLWTTLLLGARKNLKGASLKAALSGSYWLPLEDCDDIASFLEGMDCSALGDEHADEYLNEDDSFVDPFIGSTRWMLFPHGPGVAIELGGLAALDLEAPYYDIVIDGRRAARLLNNDESLRLLSLPNHSIPDAPLTFRMPDPLRPVMRASLLDPTGSTRAAQDVRLWANDEAVSVRQLTASSSGTPSGSQNLVIADACLVVNPDDVELFPLDDNRFFGIVQSTSDSKHLALKLGQDTVWSSSDSVAEGTGHQRSPVTASLVSVTEGTRGSKHLRIALVASNKLEMSSVWYGSTELSLAPRSPITMEVEVSAAAACHEVDLLVVGRAAAGRLVTKRLRIEVPINGFFRIRNGELERCPPTRPVTRASVAEGRYIFLPKRPNDDDNS